MQENQHDDQLLVSLKSEYVRFFNIISQAKRRAIREGRVLTIICGEAHEGMREFIARFIISNICSRLGIMNQNLEQPAGHSIRDLSRTGALSRYAAIAQYAYASGAKIANIDIEGTSIDDEYEFMADEPQERPYARTELALRESINCLLTRNDIMVESILSQGDCHSVAFVGYGHVHGIASTLCRSPLYLVLPIDLTHLMSNLDLEQEQIPDIPWFSLTKNLPLYETMAIDFDESEVESLNQSEFASLSQSQDCIVPYSPSTPNKQNVCFVDDEYSNDSPYLTCYKKFLRFSLQPGLAQRTIYSKNALQKHIMGPTNTIINELDLDAEQHSLELTNTAPRFV